MDPMGNDNNGGSGSWLMDDFLLVDIGEFCLDVHL